MIKTIKQAFSQFSRDDAMTLAAAVAFYTALSLAPMLVLMLTVAGWLGASTRTALVDRVEQIVGSEAGQTVQTIVEHANEQQFAGSIAGAISLGVLLISATGAFVQLQHALNRVWNVERQPGLGIRGVIGKRLSSLVMLLVLGLLLVASVAVSAVLSGLLGQAQDVLPGANWLWQGLNVIVSIGVFTLLFAAIYRILPDVVIHWRDVWFGALATAVLFTIGRFLLGLYLGNAGVGSAYGAAGSLIALLVWVYYSTIILLFGAELTQAWVQRRGRLIEPDQRAKWISPRSPGTANHHASQEPSRSLASSSSERAGDSGGQDDTHADHSQRRPRPA